jgi:hypothetical protein
MAYLSETFLMREFGFNLGCENSWPWWKQIVKRYVILCGEMQYRDQRIYAANNPAGPLFI